MSDYLTGVEAYELDAVEAVLDADPSSSDVVYKETIKLSERSIAAVAAKRAGEGGGSQTGPFVLTDDNDVRRGQLFFDADEQEVSLNFYDTDGDTVLARVVLNATSIHNEAVETVDGDLQGPTAAGHKTLEARPVPVGGATGGTDFYLHSDPVGGVNNGEAFHMIYGPMDPSVPDGVEAVVGTMFSRTFDDGGPTGQLWFKTGPAATDWVNLTP